jgi:hypothetical protein
MGLDVRRHPNPTWCPTRGDGWRGRWAVGVDAEHALATASRFELRGQVQGRGLLLHGAGFTSNGLLCDTRMTSPHG